MNNIFINLHKCEKIINRKNICNQILKQKMELHFNYPELNAKLTGEKLDHTIKIFFNKINQDFRIFKYLPFFILRLKNLFQQKILFKTIKLK